MTVTDFCFDGLYLSDFNCIIANFDNNSRETSGGNTEYDSIKAPGRDKFRFYGSQYNEPLSTTFSIIKNPCLSNSVENMTFTHNEERKLTKWLKKTDGYKWFKYVESNKPTISNKYFSVSLGQEINSDVSDIWYQVKFDIVPHRIYDNLIGFDLTVTSNCAYGFTDVITKQATINASTPFVFEVDTDADEYIYPEEFNISNVTQSNFKVENTYDKEHKIQLDTATSFFKLMLDTPTDSNIVNESLTRSKISSWYSVNKNLKDRENEIINLEDYSAVYLKIPDGTVIDETNKNIYSNHLCIRFLSENESINEKVYNINLYENKSGLYFFETSQYKHIRIDSQDYIYDTDVFVNLQIVTYSLNLNFNKILDAQKSFGSTSLIINKVDYPVASTCAIDTALGIFIFDENDNLLRKELYINPTEEIHVEKKDYRESKYSLINMMPSPDGIYTPNNTSIGNIENYVDLNITETINNLMLGEPLRLNCENEIIKGLDEPSNFNWYFPRLIDKKNEIATDSPTDINVEIKYREARMVAL